MKRTILLLLIVMPASVLLAQSTEELAADFERAKKLTLSYLEAMPADQYGFRPSDEVRTFAQQMLHSSQGIFNLVSNGAGSERMYVDINLEQEAKYQAKEEVIRISNESYDYAIAAILALDPATLNQFIKRGPMVVTRFGWIMKAFEHLTHHRGQCAVYMRLVGIAPPQFQLF